MPKKSEIGEGHVHLASESDGPFRCDHCTWYKSTPRYFGVCGHPEVVEDKALKHLRVQTNEGERVKVHGGQCCDYYRPVEIIADVKFDDVIKAIN